MREVRLNIKSEENMMLQRICIMIVLVVIILTSTVFAAIPAKMNIENANERSQETLLIHSVEGTAYNLFLISDNAKYNSRYLSEKSGIYVGDYYVYLARVGDDTAVLQTGIRPFPTLDRTGNTPNGCYVISSQTGMPDILENLFRATGGGGYAATFYAIKDNRLKEIKFMDKDKRITSGYKAIDLYREKDAARYLDDGTFYLHTWANAWPNAGTYKTVYMFDTKNLIMIRAYG